MIAQDSTKNMKIEVGYRTYIYLITPMAEHIISHNISCCLIHYSTIQQLHPFIQTSVIIWFLGSQKNYYDMVWMCKCDKCATINDTVTNVQDVPKCHFSFHTKEVWMYSNIEQDLSVNTTLYALESPLLLILLSLYMVFRGTRVHYPKWTRSSRLVR